MINHDRFQTVLWFDHLKCTSLHDFLSRHCKVTSVQYVGVDHLIISTNQTQEEYVAFTDYVASKFRANVLHQKKLCHAKCRDDTLCLNRITQEDYCWRHSFSGNKAKLMF